MRVNRREQSAERSVGALEPRLDLVQAIHRVPAAERLNAARTGRRDRRARAPRPALVDQQREQLGRDQRHVTAEQHDPVVPERARVAERGVEPRERPRATYAIPECATPERDADLGQVGDHDHVRAHGRDRGDGARDQRLAEKGGERLGRAEAGAATAREHGAERPPPPHRGDPFGAMPGAHQNVNAVLA
jgi:hypothetical protein